jgi:hypothetical protein
MSGLLWVVWGLPGVRRRRQLDADFGMGGIVVTQVATGTKDDVGTALLLQADERVPTTRVLLAGSANASNHDVAVTRYWR